jgi:hypothetical protein
VGKECEKGMKEGMKGDWGQMTHKKEGHKKRHRRRHRKRHRKRHEEKRENQDRYDFPRIEEIIGLEN